MALASAVVCAGLLAHAVLMSSYLEPTATALDLAQRGREVAFFAVPGLLLGIVAVLVSSRRWVAVPLLGSVALALIGLAFDLRG